MEIHQIQLGRLQVPEDADDILSFVHRQPGVVNVWLNGDTISLECEAGLVDRDKLVERLSDDGYRVA
jgi:hypothetical protein